MKKYEDRHIPIICNLDNVYKKPMVGDDGNFIVIFSETPETTESAARQMCIAPELLGELKGLLLVLPPQVKADIPGHIKAAEAIIAKAEGRS